MAPPGRRMSTHGGRAGPRSLAGEDQRERANTSYRDRRKHRGVVVRRWSHGRGRRPHTDGASSGSGHDAARQREASRAIAATNSAAARSSVASSSCPVSATARSSSVPRSRPDTGRYLGGNERRRSATEPLERAGDHHPRPLPTTRRIVVGHECGAGVPPCHEAQRQRQLGNQFVGHLSSHLGHRPLGGLVECAHQTDVAARTEAATASPVALIDLAFHPLKHVHDLQRPLGFSDRRRSWIHGYHRTPFPLPLTYAFRPNSSDARPTAAAGAQGTKLPSAPDHQRRQGCPRVRGPRRVGPVPLPEWPVLQAHDLHNGRALTALAPRPVSPHSRRSVRPRPCL